MPLSPSTPVTDSSPDGPGFQHVQAVDEIFDYARFLWSSSDGDFWQPDALDIGAGLNFDSQNTGTHFQIHGPNNILRTAFQDQDSHLGPLTVASDNSGPSGNTPAPTGPDELMDYFARAVIPPILAEVETKKKWATMRQAVVKMGRTSTVVRFAILAFADLLLYRAGGCRVANPEDYYYTCAVAELRASTPSSLVGHTTHRENLLAAIFFLSYVDILESRLTEAHSHLKRAFMIFQQGEKGSFAPIERQFLLWIRLLDARAVSAGGEGLFLSDDNDSLLVETSPATMEAEADEFKGDDLEDGGIEDVLFQVLYQPGIAFYQKVQSFSGRIAKIDPWHRSRGTVEDEIEVMNIGAVIAADLKTLYEQRPPLMDYAVAGKLVQPHVSAHLAFVITRSFRTYLSNYYASKIHLHRVAYKTLPLTADALDALDHIRRLARMIGAGLDPDDALPVNMLWPLLMLGVEEQDLDEKTWIRTQIVRMEKVAGNARITAQVLDEVQKKQDAAKVRMDIRSVMQEMFDSCFAIL